MFAQNVHAQKNKFGRIQIREFIVTLNKMERRGNQWHVLLALINALVKEISTREICTSKVLLRSEILRNHPTIKGHTYGQMTTLSCE